MFGLKEIHRDVLEVKDWVGKLSAIVETQASMVEYLMTQNKEFADRLMARDLPELKTYTAHETEDTASLRREVMDFAADEENAGEVIIGEE